MVKKKRLVVFASILVIGLVILIGFYWFGYIEFHGPIPSFNPNPTNRSEGTPKVIIESIKGRFNKIYADIKNIGEKNATEVKWSISVTGGILKRINVLSSGTIDTLSVNMGKTVGTDKFILGFGRVNIKVTVEATQVVPVTMTSRGFVFFFLLIGVRV
jgi:hypothetical protein